MTAPDYLPSLRHPAPSAVPAHVRWLLASVATALILAAALSAASQTAPSQASARQGRVLAVGAPTHGTVQPGKVLAPAPKFAPGGVRGTRRVLTRASNPEPRAEQATRRPGILLM
jgi:hypothetical protein